MRVISLLVLLGLTLVSPASAQTQVAPPFSKLFRPPSTPLLKPATPVTPPERSAANQIPLRQPPNVVCGMTLIPVDPSFDANIRRPVPPSGTKFTIKTLKPPLCGQ